MIDSPNFPEIENKLVLILKKNDQVLSNFAIQIFTIILMKNSKKL